VPVLGQVADAVSMALACEAQAANLLRTAITGGNMKLALEEAGMSIGAQALSLVAGPRQSWQYIFDRMPREHLSGVMH
ncbi:MULTISPECIES: HrpF/NolX family T3SS translocon protein, partial [Microvirga]|uniref:HrpF/NolX family T3SS translocon protein n=1 Tax=Microvirga TaxID=186650 RepID=UPI00358DB5BB